MAEKTDSVSITAKLKSLIATAEVWKDKMAEAATLQNGIFTETHRIATELKASLEENIQVAIDFAEQVKKSLNEITTAQQLAAITWEETTGAASDRLNAYGNINKNPFTAADYISGASTLTTEQKTEFLRIVTDQDKYALDTLLAEYKKQINEIYTDEYQSIKTERDQLDGQRAALGEKIQSELAAIKGKETSVDYRSTIKLIEKQRMEMSMLSNKSDLLTQRIGQFDQSAQRIEGQMAVLTRAWDDSAMQQSLASGARGTESKGYSKDEVQWLVNKALETGAGSKFDSVALTELLKKLDSALPTKLYKLDLTAGDQKLSAFTDLSPEKFLEALFTARKSALL